MDEAPKMSEDDNRHTTASPQAMAQTPALRSSDVVVAIMGVTGSGKSTFVSQLVGQENVVVGHSLQSETKVTSTYEFRRPGQESIHVVDTPGFDDTYVSDAEVLRDIAAFMSKTYESHVKLAGIIYLHRITDNRVSGSALRNLRMFKQLCGQDAYKHVVLVTSMWDRLPSGDEEKATLREKELIGGDGFWKDMYARGSHVKRWDGDSVSANTIIDDLLAARNSNGDATLQIQRELVDEKKKLALTSAGREVNKELAEIEERFAREMEEIMASSQAAIVEGDVRLHEELQIYRRDFEEQQRKAIEGQEALQVNFHALLAENEEKYRRKTKSLMQELEDNNVSVDVLTAESTRQREENRRLRKLLEVHDSRSQLTDPDKVKLELRLMAGEAAVAKLAKEAEEKKKKKDKLKKVLHGIGSTAVGVMTAFSGGFLVELWKPLLKTDED